MKVKDEAVAAKVRVLTLYNGKVVTVVQPDGHRWVGPLISVDDKLDKWFVKYGSDVNVEIVATNIKGLFIGAYGNLDIIVFKEV